MQEICNGKYICVYRTEREKEFFYDTQKKIFFDWSKDGNYYHGYELFFGTYEKERLIEALDLEYGLSDEEKEAIMSLEQAPVSNRTKEWWKKLSHTPGEGQVYAMRFDEELKDYEPDIDFFKEVIPKEFW